MFQIMIFEKYPRHAAVNKHGKHLNAPYEYTPIKIPLNLILGVK